MINFQSDLTTSEINDMYLSDADLEDLQEVPLKKGNPVYVIQVYADTEYEGSLPVTLQVVFQGEIISYKKKYINQVMVFVETILEINQRLIIVDKSLESSIQTTDLYNFSKRRNCIVLFKDLYVTDQTSPLTDAFIEILYTHYNFFPGEKPIRFHFNYWFYFSPKDISIAFGNVNVKNFYIKKKILHRNSLTGCFLIYNTEKSVNIEFLVTLKDLSGLEKGGLAVMAASYGKDFKKSKYLDEFKTSMYGRFAEAPIAILDYGLSDAEILIDIVEASVKAFNDMLENVFGIHDLEHLFTYQNFPTTIGRLVFLMYMKYFNLIILKNDPSLMLAFNSQGILNPLHKNYSKNLEVYEELKSVSSLDQLRNLSLKEQKKFFSLNERGVFRYLPLQYSSSKYLQDISTAIVSYVSLSLVSGGRVVNEYPTQVSFQTGADFDISSAYGGVLEKSGLPIGKPQTFSVPFNEKPKYTLGSFLQKYGRKKTKHWKLIVSGQLTFNQDLLFSRVVASEFVKKKAQNFDPNDADTMASEGTFALLRREIVDATITPSLLEIIDKVATNQELKEIYELTVQSALFFLETHQVSSIEELADSYLLHRSKDKDKANFCENWLYLPFDGFISPLIQKRKSLKAARQNFPLQMSLKLTVNTFYGILSSKFFTINNVIVADHITSVIRGNVWLMAKALNLKFTVCDGGLCVLETVAFLGRNKPGFDSLSYAPDFGTKDNLKLKPLAGLDWNNEFKNLNLEGATVAALAQTHLTQFWSAYDITINFSLETKLFVRRGSYFMKAHYLFEIYDEATKDWSPDYYHRIRGVRKGDLKNPIYLFLVFLLENGHKDNFLDLKYVIPNEGVYESEKILRVKSWLKTLDVHKESILGYQIMPGDNVYEYRLFRINNHYFPIFFYKELSKRRNRQSQTQPDKKNPGQKQVQILFEKYLSESIGFMLKRMEQDKLK